MVQVICNYCQASLEVPESDVTRFVYCWHCGCETPSRKEADGANAQEKPTPNAALRLARRDGIDGGVGTLLILVGGAIFVAAVIISLAVSLPFFVKMVIFGVLGAIGAGLFNHGRSMVAPRAGDLVEEDSRPPVLLLRSFNDDGMHNTIATPEFDLLRELELRNPSYEETLSSIFAEVGPMLAIGRPEEMAPPLGAGRHYVSHDVWQQDVERLIASARTIVMIMGDVDDGKGLGFEVEAILKQGALRKLILIMPAWQTNPESIWSGYRYLLGDRMPPFQPDRSVVMFNREGIGYLVKDVHDAKAFLTGRTARVEWNRCAAREGLYAAVPGLLLGGLIPLFGIGMSLGKQHLENPNVIVYAVVIVGALLGAACAFAIGWLNVERRHG